MRMASFNPISQSLPQIYALTSKYNCPKLEFITFISIIYLVKLLVQCFRISASTYEADWDRNVMVCIEDSEPCYIFYRLDDKVK